MGAAGDRRLRDRPARGHRRHRPQAHPAREPLRRRPRAPAGRHHRPPARLVLAHALPPDVLAGPVRRPPAALPRVPGRLPQRHPRRGRPVPALHPHLRDPDPAAVLREPLHHLRADALLRHQADEGVRAGGCGLGRQARRRPRPGRAEGGGHQGHRPVVGGRGLPQGGRQARAGPALPRRAGYRQDDALQGDRDLVQLADRDHAGLGIRADVHGPGRHHRDVPDRQGAAPGAQVGRHVHGLHRRDRRGRDAPPGDRSRPSRSTTSCSTASGAR
jgi:hypothetical protein